MAQIQIEVAAVPAVIIMDSINKTIAFKKVRKEAFIDRVKDLDQDVVWNDKNVVIGEKQYPYNQWHAVEKDSTFKAYFKDLISKGHNPYNHVVVM